MAEKTLEKLANAAVYRLLAELQLASAGDEPEAWASTILGPWEAGVWITSVPAWPETIEDRGPFVRATVEAAKSIGASPRETARIARQPDGSLSETERLILAALSDREPRTQKDVARRTGLADGAYLERMLRGLFRGGWVVEHVRGWMRAP